MQRSVSGYGFGLGMRVWKGRWDGIQIRVPVREGFRWWRLKARVAGDLSQFHFSYFATLPMDLTFTFTLLYKLKIQTDTGVLVTKFVSSNQLADILINPLSKEAPRYLRTKLCVHPHSCLPCKPYREPRSSPWRQPCKELRPSQPCRVTRPGLLCNPIMIQDMKK